MVKYKKKVIIDKKKGYNVVQKCTFVFKNVIEQFGYLGWKWGKGM